MDVPAIIREVEDSGWASFEVDPTDSLERVGASFGQIVPSRRGGRAVDLLTPTPRELARQRSMSAVYGTGPLPFHTDSSNFKVPPRLALLRLASGSRSDRATLLIDFRDLELSTPERLRVHRDVWLVNGGRGRFYASIVSDSLVRGAKVVRFDRCCMKPAHSAFAESGAILERACANAQPTNISWCEGRVVALDNWRMLHARSPGPDSGPSTRTLERTLVLHSDALEVP